VNDNFILLTDSYKNSHDVQYPPGTTRVTSYFESRVGAKWDHTVFFGLQYLVRRYLQKPITKADVDEAESYFMSHMGGFNRAKWDYIVEKHGGYLPLKIRAVPEGTVVPVSNVLMTVENTDDACYWLTNYAETLLVQAWYPSTVATQSRAMKAMILKYLVDTGTPELIDFKLHDFGCRGVSSMETAAIGGAAHLVNFKGTDTIPALQLLREYYYEPMAGFSIPASEHSTITSWGEKGEVDAMRNMIKQYGDGSLYACVSDSFDIYRACDHHWGLQLHDEVLGANATLVVRPDSGDPKKVVPEVLNILWNRFGGTTNAKNYKVLNPKVRVIQGDGIDVNTLDDILWHVKAAGFSADNIAFGSGGGLLQKMNRDTQRFAFKCSQVVVNGVERDVFKAPISDHTKVSKAGRLELFERAEAVEIQDRWRMQWSKFFTADPKEVVENGDWPKRALQDVFFNGMIRSVDPLSTIRARAAL
jgi:nicotinamide phosphoribosyltransferase